jgi:type II secretory pathway component PulK
MRYLGPNSVQAARRGFALPAVLAVVVLLSLAAYQFGDTMASEADAADSFRRSMQARALADSGVAYAAAILSNADTFTNMLNSNPYDNPTCFQGRQVTPDGATLLGRFSLVAPIDTDDPAFGSQPFRYGVLDEAGKININALMRLDSSGKILHDVLVLLPNMTEDIANCIIDWLDADDEPRASGAEVDYYATLSPPYKPRNGPIDSLEELLLVKGVTPQLLYGNDKNRNGFLDVDEDDGTGMVDMGWSAYLTVHSREQNLDSTGSPRIYVNDSDLQTLLTNLTNAVGEDMANFIIAYRMYGASTGAGAGAPGATTLPDSPTRPTVVPTSTPRGPTTPTMPVAPKTPPTTPRTPTTPPAPTKPAPGPSKPGMTFLNGRNDPAALLTALTVMMNGSGGRPAVRQPARGSSAGTGGAPASGSGQPTSTPRTTTPSPSPAPSSGSTGASRGAGAMGAGAVGAGAMGGGASGAGASRLTRSSLGAVGGGGGGGGQSQPKTISSLYELINATVSIPSTTPNQPAQKYPSPLNDPAQLAQLLPLVLDKLTTQKATELPARVNVLTAPAKVLATLPGITDTDVQAITGKRPSSASTDPVDPIFQTPAWLMTDANLTADKLKALERYITSRSQTYRVQVLGYYDSGGPTARVEAIIDTNNGRPRVIYYRDLTELGKGFDLQTGQP